MQGAAQTAAPAKVRLGGRGLSKSFGPLKANDRIDLAAAPGTILAIVGGNGAGKSTLMKMLQGLQPPDAGTVVVNDAPVSFRSAREAIRAGIGMVHQEFTLISGLTLLENLILGDEPRTRLGTIDRAAALARAEELATLAGARIDWSLREERAPVHMRQAVEILRLIYRGADVLILDEPTAGLAPIIVEELFAQLRVLADDGVAILMVEQNARAALRISDRGYVLAEGRNRIDGAASALLDDPQVVAAFLGGRSLDAPRSSS